MSRLRRIIAVWAAKATGFACRITGKQGVTLGRTDRSEDRSGYFKRALRPGKGEDLCHLRNQRKNHHQQPSLLRHRGGGEKGGLQPYGLQYAQRCGSSLRPERFLKRQSEGRLCLHRGGRGFHGPDFSTFQAGLHGADQSLPGPAGPVRWRSTLP